MKPSWEKIGRITESAKVRNRRLQREEATGKRFKVTGKLSLSHPRSLKLCRTHILGDKQPDWSQSKSNQLWLSPPICQLWILTSGLLILPVVVRLPWQDHNINRQLARFISPDVCGPGRHCVLINTVGLISTSSLVLTGSQTHSHWAADRIIPYCFPHWLR